MFPSSFAPFLIGKRVQLRPLERSDLPLLARWNNDPEIRCLTGEVYPATVHSTEAWFDRNKDDPRGSGLSSKNAKQAIPLASVACCAYSRHGVPPT